MSDVVVIGGGIVGVSTALFLAEGGVDVTLVERKDVAAEASGLNGGVVGRSRLVPAGASADADTELATGGIAFYRRLAEDLGHDIGLNIGGSLSVIPTEADLAWVEGLELVNAELLDGAAARAIEPALDPGIAGAVWAPDTISAEPVAAVTAAATEATAAGARIETGRGVTGIRASGDRFRVDLEGAVVEAGAVAITAGPWSGELARLLDPALDVPVMGVLGQMWATAPVPPTLSTAISSVESLRYWATSAETTPPNVTHDGDRRLTRHLYGRQRPNGEIVFGGDRRRFSGDRTTDDRPVDDRAVDDRAVDDRGIATNFGQAAELLPVLRDLRPIRTWAGVMPWTADGKPILGPLAGADGVFVAAGLASSGFTRGPMTGRRLADLILATA